jgi:hypothetical protein
LCGLHRSLRRKRIRRSAETLLKAPVLPFGYFSRANEQRGAGDATRSRRAQTDECVAATTNGALGRGLRVTVVADAHSTWGYGGETADQIIARYNVLFAEAGASVLALAALVGSETQ